MLGGAQSVGATDETVTTTVAGANALLGATTVMGGYAVDDSHIAIQSAFDDGLEGILTGAVSVKVGATASLTVFMPSSSSSRTRVTWTRPVASTASWTPWRR